VIGPYANPSEIYEYYTLPFCLPPDATHRHLGLGEVIEGNRDVRINSLYDLRFRVEVEWSRLCKMNLAVADVEVHFPVNSNAYMHRNSSELLKKTIISK